MPRVTASCDEHDNVTVWAGEGRHRKEDRITTVCETTRMKREKGDLLHHEAFIKL